MSRNNLFLVDRIDCEDENPENTPLVELVAPIQKLADRGYAMPTLLIRFAGKNDEAVLKNASLMKAVKDLHKCGSPVGIHVHSDFDSNGEKNFAQYNDSHVMSELVGRACERFKRVFFDEPQFFGMGDLSCGNESVASMLSGYGIRMDISDVVVNRWFRVNGKVVFNYSGNKWNFKLPSFSHGLWWIPHGTDRSPGDFLSLRNRLSLLMGQKEKEFAKVFETYAYIGEQYPKVPVIISSIVHPPETLERWDAWVSMHKIADSMGFSNIDANEALLLLDSTFN